MNGAIRKTMRPQASHVNRGHGRRGSRYLDGVGTQRTIRGGQRRLSPIRGHGMDKPISFYSIGNPKIGDLSPEVVRMGAPSVKAMIFGRNHHRQQFALAATEG